MTQNNTGPDDIFRMFRVPHTVKYGHIRLKTNEREKYYWIVIFGWSSSLTQISISNFYRTFCDVCLQQQPRGRGLAKVHKLGNKELNQSINKNTPGFKTNLQTLNIKTPNTLLISAVCESRLIKSKTDQKVFLAFTCTHTH